MIVMAGDGIFISYRRADSASMAGRIRERLVDGLPDRSVFLDVQSIELGSDFETSIESELRRSSVLLVLIGTDWLAVEAGTERSRLFDPDDYVRREIAWALQAGMRIIPVLIDDAKMPGASSLPAEIGEFAMKNAAEVRNSRFDDDARRLLTAIDPRAWQPDPRTARRGRLLWSIAAGAAVGLAVLFGLLIAHQEITREPMAARLGLWGSVLLVPVFAVGGGLVGWRLHRRRRPHAGSPP